jgi:NADPH:quinone reductase-like Zn-dependent oxidoreductase
VFAVTAARISREDPISAMELGEHPDPDPEEGWEVVRVRAASLNHHDLWTLRGVGIDEDRLPIVLGCDAAGTTADGREVIVHSVIAGDDHPDETMDPAREILSERHDGTHAGLVAVPRRNLIDKPAELSFEEACCLPTAWLTAYRMLFTRAGARPGARVLVQGAGGGVSTAAVLLARAAGMRVWVTSRDEQKRERAVELGAHAAFEPGERLPEQVDVVMETVGEATWEHSLRSLVPGGTIVVSGATTGFNPPADIRRMFWRQLRVVGSTMGTRDELVSLVRMLQATGVRPLIDSTHALTDAREAYAKLARGEAFGKIVLTAGG